MFFWKVLLGLFNVRMTVRLGPRLESAQKTRIGDLWIDWSIAGISDLDLCRNRLAHPSILLQRDR